MDVALLLLEKRASPHAAAKNGYSPLHIAAKKNQMDIANNLLNYGAKANAESKAGFTPLHLACQEGHTDMASLLIRFHADVNAGAKVSCWQFLEYILMLNLTLKMLYVIY